MKIIGITLVSISLITVGLSVGGCAFYDKNLGSRVELNRSAQVINAEAVEADVSITTLEGQKAEALMSRYRKEKAKAPTEGLLKDVGK